MSLLIVGSVAIDTVVWVVTQLLRDGRVRRGYLGIAGATVPLSRRVARFFVLPNERAVRVESTAEDGPARRAGLIPGDLVVAFAGARVEGIDDLHRLLVAERIGTPAALDVIRGTRRLAIQAAPATIRAMIATQFAMRTA